jgi:hypothetical protein
MVLDKRRLLVKAFYKMGNLVGCINEILGIIRDNFRNVEGYQSIYDLHELLISLLMKLAEEKGVKGKVTAEFVCNELDNEAVPQEGEEFKDIAEGGDLKQSIK